MKYGEADIQMQSNITLGALLLDLLLQCVFQVICKQLV